MSTNTIEEKIKEFKQRFTYLGGNQADQLQRQMSSVDADIVFDWLRDFAEHLQKEAVEELTKKVTRVEVIDHTPSEKQGFDRGRVYTKRDDAMQVELSLQDDNRTLKVFLTNPTPLASKK